MRLFLLVLVMGGWGWAAEKSELEGMRDAATHEDLVRRLQQSQKEDPMSKLAPSEGKDPSVVNQPANLLSQSDFISFGGVATLVPKRAILRVPAKHTERLKLEPGLRIVSWPEFYAMNRAWITTVEVSRAQAEGNQVLGKETHEMMEKTGNLVVATLSGGPISVLPLKKEETGEEREDKEVEPANMR